MKYCSKCGTQTNDDTRFCSQCGAVFEDVQNVINSDDGMPRTDSAAEALKKLGSSGTFLAAIIFFAIGIVLTFAASITSMSSTAGYIYMFAEMMDMESEILPYLNSITEVAMTSGVVSAVVSSIPSIIILIGLILIYSALSSKNKTRISTAGFTIIKVLSIVQLIFFCVCICIAEIALILTMMIASGSFSGSEITGAFIAGILILSAAAALVIVFYAKIIGSLNAAKEVITTGTPNHKASRFIGVVCFIAAAVSILSLMIQSAQLLFGIGISGIMLGILSTAIGAVVMILFGIIIFKYRSTMKKLQ